MKEEREKEEGRERNMHGEGRPDVLAERSLWAIFENSKNSREFQALVSVAVLCALVQLQLGANGRCLGGVFGRPPRHPGSNLSDLERKSLKFLYRGGAVALVADPCALD